MMASGKGKAWWKNLLWNIKIPPSLSKNWERNPPVFMFFLKRGNKLELEEEEEEERGLAEEKQAKGRHSGSENAPPSPPAELLIKPARGPHTVSEVNPWLGCSYPQRHKAWCTRDRAQRRGILRVYGIRREKFFSGMNSHVIDVLKVDRRGDQAGVMMRGWIREAWLTKRQKEQKSWGHENGVTGHRGHFTACMQQKRHVSHQDWVLHEILSDLRELNFGVLLPVTERADVQKIICFIKLLLLFLLLLASGKQKADFRSCKETFRV